MILSVSRRTDIPAFYSDWFYNRIKAGFVDVRNPMNYHRISRVTIRPELVDCIVFWTKNAIPFTTRLDELSAYKYYFQYTINSYNASIEENVPLKKNIIANFQTLSQLIGADRVIWRYDPIILTDDLSFQYHLKYFEEIARRLYGYTKLCIISFVDMYKRVEKNMEGIPFVPIDEELQKKFAFTFANIARKYEMKVQSCSESLDLSAQGVEHASCVDLHLIEKIVGYTLNVRKDKNQRQQCGCVESIDIGQYNSCMHHCKYCYANYNYKTVLTQIQKHDSLSSLLVGNIEEGDIITERKVSLLRNTDLFLL